MLNSSKRLDFKDNSDSVIYFCGLIKNLTENQRILKKLSVKNVEEILLRLFKELNKYVIRHSDILRFFMTNNCIVLINVCLLICLF